MTKAFERAIQKRNCEHAALEREGDRASRESLVRLRLKSRLYISMQWSLDFEAASIDPNFFSGDASLNFERDFAAWFDPENAA